MNPACGRGWAAIGTVSRLVGHFYIHNGDDSGFVCERVNRRAILALTHMWNGPVGKVFVA